MRRTRNTYVRTGAGICAHSDSDIRACRRSNICARADIHASIVSVIVRSVINCGD